MAQTAHVVPLVLVYDSMLHRAAWMTPAQAWLLCDSRDGICDIVDPSDKHFDEYARLAGRKPVIFSP